MNTLWDAFIRHFPAWQQNLLIYFRVTDPNSWGVGRFQIAVWSITPLPGLLAYGFYALLDAVLSFSHSSVFFSNIQIKPLLHCEIHGSRFVQKYSKIPMKSVIFLSTNTWEWMRCLSLPLTLCSKHACLTLSVGNAVLLSKSLLKQLHSSEIPSYASKILSLFCVVFKQCWWVES